jgi:hypothetical protein
MKKILPLTLLSYMLYAGCSKENLISISPPEEIATTLVSANGSVSVRDVPIDAVFFNDCCNEEVYVTGTAHFVDNKNIQHVEVNNITGIGLTSGLSYVSLSLSVLSNVFYSDHYVGIFTFILNMKNESGCSFRIKATFQSHVNAGGDIVVEFQNFTTFCY